MLRTAAVLAVLALFSPALVPAAEPPPLDPVRWLRDYLQIDTTNPPGGETAAAE